MNCFIYCELCGEKAFLLPGDKAKGWGWRKISFPVVKPPEHFITINGVRQEEMETIKCDRCGDNIPDGRRVFAVTMWRTELEGEPGPWEQEYQKHS